MNATHLLASAAAASALLLQDAPPPDVDEAQRAGAAAAVDSTQQALDGIRQRLRRELDARLATRPWPRRAEDPVQHLAPGLVIAPQDGMPIVVPDASASNMPVVVPRRTEPMPTVQPEAPYIPGPRIARTDTVGALLLAAADSLAAAGAGDSLGVEDGGAGDAATARRPARRPGAPGPR